jgi:2'-5' RNA ligase
MKVGIALVPCCQTIQLMIEMQQKIISDNPLVPIWGNINNLPHITLLQGRFHHPINWINLVYNLQNYWQKQKYFEEFQITKLEYKTPGWYFLKLNNEHIFFDLHNFIFTSVKNLIYVTEEDLKKDISSYTDSEKINYIKYGYRYIGSGFNPHFTLGRIIDNSIDNRQSSWKGIIEFFATQNLIKIQQITIYQVGNYGSHAATLYSVNI